MLSHAVLLRQRRQHSHEHECAMISRATQVVMHGVLVHFGRTEERRTAMLHHVVHFRVPKEEVWNERREERWQEVFIYTRQEPVRCS